MAFQQDDVCVSHQLVVGDGFPKTALGVGLAKIRGSSFIEGPSIFGIDKEFSTVEGNVMIGPVDNIDSPIPVLKGNIAGFNHSPYSLTVVGDVCVFDNLTVNKQIEVGSHLLAQGEVISRVQGSQHILSLKKNFDIPHPTKEGWRLRHTCPEGPYNDVYIRGRIKNKNIISLPEYWKELVDDSTITVSLTPIGAHQDVIVKGISDNKVFLQSKGGIPINCYYHIFAERKDGESLISEYPGSTPNDYPGDNTQYSVVGWNYDTRKDGE
jgi:hypothetical protein